MQKGTCKRVKGKRGIQVCRLANGKVRFKRLAGTGRGVAGVSGTRRRRCVQKGRGKGGRIVCRKYSGTAAKSRRRARRS